MLRASDYVIRRYEALTFMLVIKLSLSRGLKDLCLVTPLTLIHMIALFG